VTAYEFTIAAWIVQAVYWTLTMVRTKPTARRQSAPSRLLHLILFVPAFWLLFERKSSLGVLDARFIPAHSGIAWAGFAVTVVGLVFALWARMTIGTNWSATVTLKHDHELIRSGPYRLVRHPIYTGLLFAAVGTAVTFGVLRGLLGALLMFVAFFQKSRVEEQFMVEQFDGEYLAYRGSVKAIIPFIL